MTKNIPNDLRDEIKDLKVLKEAEEATILPPPDAEIPPQPKPKLEEK